MILSGLRVDVLPCRAVHLKFSVSNLKLRNFYYDFVDDILHIMHFACAFVMDNYC